MLQCFGFLTIFSYDTPKYLKQTGQDAKLNELMGKIYHPDRVRERIDAIQVDPPGSGSGPTYKELLFHPKFAKATLYGCLLSALQQLSGINAVMFYSGNIISGIGIDYRLGTCMTNTANWVSTIGALFLLGRFGRKSIMWTMCFAMAVTHIALGITYYYVP